MINYIDEFRDPVLARKMSGLLSEYKGGTISVMEVCGTHTMAFSRFGIRNILPEGIRLISGPGCPVCVTPVNYIDAAVELARKPMTIITTFGDMMRVPGTESSLGREKAMGADVRVVYSPLDALKIAAEHPDRSVVFLSIGFETTTPGAATTIRKAKEDGIGNFSVLSANKTMPEVLKLLAADSSVKIDAYLYPGNVCAITGTKPYEELAEKYGISGAVTGFEPLDLLFSLTYIVTALKEKRTFFYNQYSRVVKPEGNRAALSVMQEVFVPCDASWRGIGIIPGSGLRIRSSYEEYDAWKVFSLRQQEIPEPAGCKCGEILKGSTTPDSCGLFGTACSPDNPVGPCMVSSEGTCAAFYKYGGTNV